jgi:thioredoxin-related protein
LIEISRYFYLFAYYIKQSISVSGIMRLLTNFYSLILLLSLLPAAVQADRPELKYLTDARETGRLAESRQLPILIMFGTNECPYCELLREDFLIPMLISGDYTEKVIMREAHVGPGEEVIDFTGKKMSIDEFSQRYRVRLFPTLVFVDSNGQQIVKKILGVTTPELFGGTLDDAIDRALMLTRKIQPDKTVTK